MIIDYFRLTDDKAEIRSIAERLVKEVHVSDKRGTKLLYTPQMLQRMRERIQRFAPDNSSEEQEEMLWRFIYDFWAFGCTVDEEFYLGLIHKTAEEKQEYMLMQFLQIYVYHLNQDAGPDRVDQLGDKYRLYQRLKPYYKREAMELRGEDDYETFVAFAKKHDVFVVKPADYSRAIGVHKASAKEYGGDYRAMMEAILREGQAIHDKHPSKDSRMILEELICQDASLDRLYSDSDSVNVIRATAVRGKDGKIHIYHPWIKVGINGSFAAAAMEDGFVAEIDPCTGIIISDGYQGTGGIFQFHPNSGIPIKGFQIHRWDELVAMVQELMDQLPEFGYIGWDLALTPEGWCVVEGNYAGQFTYQMMNSRGYRREFEKLIGWKLETEFWWERSDHYTLICK